MTAPRVYNPYERINMRDVPALSPAKAIALYLWSMGWMLAVLAAFLRIVK